MTSLFINVKAENISKSDNDATEDFFVNLDEEGNPIVVNIEDTFNKKEYNKSLQESEEPVVQNESTEDIKTEALLNSKKTIHSNQLMKTTTAQNNHIVRFKTSAEIGGTLTYIETDTGRQGYINTNSSNNAAFISENNDGAITCKLSGVEMKVPESSVKSIVSYSEGNVSYYYANEGKFIHKYSYINASSVAMSSC